MVAVRIPKPKSIWAIKTIAVFRPYVSEINPDAKVPVPNPAKNNILAIVPSLECSQKRSNSEILKIHFHQYMILNHLMFVAQYL